MVLKCLTCCMIVEEFRLKCILVYEKVMWFLVLNWSNNISVWAVYRMRSCKLQIWVLINVLVNGCVVTYGKFKRLDIVHPKVMFYGQKRCMVNIERVKLYVWPDASYVVFGFSNFIQQPRSVVDFSPYQSLTPPFLAIYLCLFWMSQSPSYPFKMQIFMNFHLKYSALNFSSISLVHLYYALVHSPYENPNHRGMVVR